MACARSQRTMFSRAISIMFFIISLHFILGVNLLLIIYDMAKTMWYSFRYTFMTKPDISTNYFAKFIVILIVIICVAIYFVNAVIVYFFVKNNDWKFTLIFSLISIIMFGEIILSACYSSFYSHDFNNKTESVMRKDMELNEDTGALNVGWKKFQINMKCCGIHNPRDYNYTEELDSSCCGHFSSKSFTCTTSNSYQVGCYFKLKDNFHEYNQLIIWTGIVYNIFTILVLLLLRYSKMFEVINDEPKFTDFDMNSINVG